MVEEKDVYDRIQRERHGDRYGNRTDYGYCYLWQSHCCHVGGSVGMLAEK